MGKHKSKKTIYYDEIEGKCGKGVQLQKLNCRANSIVDIISKNGLDYGFSIVKKLYEKKPEFRPLCHFFTIGLGAKIYKNFPDYEKLSYSPLSTICNYGLYQEYPHSLLISTKDVKKAREFCRYTAKILTSEVPGIEAECFRGIGRGLPFIDESSLGDTRKMAKFATEKCKEISTNKEEYGICVSGVFNQLAREQNAKNYGISVNGLDPIWLCHEQPEEIKSHCYGNFKLTDVPKVENEKDLNFALKETIKKYVDKSPASAYSIIWSLGYLEALKSVAENDNYDEKIIIECSLIPHPFNEDCILGFSVGLAKHGFPWEQHKQIINFCQKAGKSEPLKNIDCSSQAIKYLKDFYSPRQFQEACYLFKKKIGVTCPAT